MVTSFRPYTLLRKDSTAVDFLRLFIDINVFFIVQLQVTASKCHFRGSIWSSSQKITKANIISTWFLLGGFCHNSILMSEAIVQRCSVKRVFYLLSSIQMEFIFTRACFTKAKLFHRVFGEHLCHYQRLSTSQDSVWWLLLKTHEFKSMHQIRKRNIFCYFSKNYKHE